MARGSARPEFEPPRRLPRGRHALAPEEVAGDQRRRLLAAVPGVLAERGYEATSVADLVKRAAVSRNAFYKSFRDKRDCVAVAHEEAHERLFDVLGRACEASDGVPAERVGAALAAAMEALDEEPDTARLLFVEAPAAGEAIALRYHQWLQRYGTLLRYAAPERAAGELPAPEVEGVIVGGIASRIASQLLQDERPRLQPLTAPFTEYVLAFFRPSEPDPGQGEVIAFEPRR